jgi:gluconate 2-dehydrogenase gamma chain
MPDSVSRRDFVAFAGAAAAAEMAPKPVEAAPAAPAPLKPLANEPEAYTYLTAPEAAFVEAAVERLIPADELGPGAREAGVAFFIEQQLNGQFGYASKTYMHGPWLPGTPMQGYQLPLTPREIYRLAIAETNAYCAKKYGKTFDKLAPATQDQVLQALDEGSVTFESVPAKLFFEMLFTNTQQGFFADPLYGGNRNKIGWKVIGHPGVPVAYNAFIGKHDVPYHVAEPVGIADVERELGVGGNN